MRQQRHEDMQVLPHRLRSARKVDNEGSATRSGSRSGEGGERLDLDCLSHHQLRDAGCGSIKH